MDVSIVAVIATYSILYHICKQHTTYTKPYVK